MKPSFTAILAGISMLFAVSLASAQDSGLKIVSLIEKADSLHRISQLDSALTLANEALVMARAEYGDSDTLLARAIYTLAQIHGTKAEYLLADSLFSEAMKIYEAVLGPDHYLIADILKHIATLDKDQGEYEPSKQSYLRAIAIYEKADEKDRIHLGAALKGLAEVYHEQGKFGEAEMRYRQALEFNTKTLGPKHVEIAQNLAGLARLYVDLGKFVEAEQYYLQAKAMFEETVGPDDLLTAKLLNNLGLLYHSQGRYEEARQNYQRALEIKEKIFGPDHPTVGVSLANLGRFYMDTKNYEEALIYFERSLTIFENALGPDHPIIGSTTNNLGLTNSLLGNYEAAEKYYRRSLEIKAKTLGENHPKYAYSLINVGLFYLDTGEFQKAESTLTRALDIFEQHLSPSHPDIELILGYLAKTYCAQGKYDIALQTYIKRQEFLQDLYQYVFSYASEDKKMSYLKMYPILESSLLSLAVEKNSREINEAAFGTLLRGKAMVVDAVSRERERAYCIQDPEVNENLSIYTQVCGEISSMVLSGAFDANPQMFRDSLDILYERKGLLETSLSKRCSEFKNKFDRRKINIANIAGRLPERSVLWDIIQYKPYEFAKIGPEEERRGSSRYMAFLLFPDGEVKSVDLGDAALIDSLVVESLRRLKEAPSVIYGGNEAEAERELSAITGRLYDLVFAPLEALLNDEQRIFISPDGELSLLPFEILPLANGAYAIEKYSLSYLSSGRDLLKAEDTGGLKSRDAVIVANPDYGFEMMAKSPEDEIMPEGIGYASSYLLVRGPAIKDGCLNELFRSLPGTYDEGEAVYNLLKNARKYKAEFLYGSTASEESLKGRKEPPAILHLATHGYFCAEADYSMNEEQNENPLIYSGLALAGCNRTISQPNDSESPAPGMEDGILTALEVSGLNLIGTELVVLSACQTGLGEVVSGEGVFGLRRAFQLAGARSIIMSMWSVPDKETRELMQGFYENWLAGDSKSEALRKSALKVISVRRKTGDSAHPLFWGGFVLLGDPD